MSDWVKGSGTGNIRGAGLGSKEATMKDGMGNRHQPGWKVKNKLTN